MTAPQFPASFAKSLKLLGAVQSGSGHPSSSQAIEIIRLSPPAVLPYSLPHTPYRAHSRARPPLGSGAAVRIDLIAQ